MKLLVDQEISELQDEIRHKGHVKALREYRRLLESKIQTLDTVADKNMPIDSVIILFKDMATEVLKLDMKMDPSTAEVSDRQLAAAMQEMHRAISKYGYRMHPPGQRTHQVSSGWEPMVGNCMENQLSILVTSTLMSRFVAPRLYQHVAIMTLEGWYRGP